VALGTLVPLAALPRSSWHSATCCICVSPRWAAIKTPICCSVQTSRWWRRRHPHSSRWLHSAGGSDLAPAHRIAGYNFRRDRAAGPCRGCRAH
jgi:hypothetical protein